MDVNINQKNYHLNDDSKAVLVGKKKIIYLILIIKQN